MSSHFIHQAYRQNGYKEPEPHRIARLRVGSLLDNPDYTKEIRINDDWTVYPDIFWHVKAIELDGGNCCSRQPALSWGPACSFLRE